jgi:NifU-like protein
MTILADSVTDLVRSAIEEMRPRLRRDGGDIELIEVEGDTVVVDLKGSCVGCALLSMTLGGVRKRLSDVVGRPLRVIPASAMPRRRQMEAAE